jgi:hypothetical protein
MKTLIILSLTLVSLNVFASGSSTEKTPVVGEDLKGECPFSPQNSRKVAPKLANDEAKKEEAKKAVAQ